MGVPVHERGRSAVQFVETARALNVDIALTVANGPKKYLASYGDRLIETAVGMYAEAVEANSIRPSKGIRAEQDYLQRRAHLIEARGKAQALAAIAQIYFEVLKAARGLQVSRGDTAESGEKIARRAKLDARMERIGAACDKEIRLINGVLKSDTERFGKYNG